MTPDRKPCESCDGTGHGQTVDDRTGETSFRSDWACFACLGTGTVAVNAEDEEETVQ